MAIHGTLSSSGFSTFVFHIEPLSGHSGFSADFSPGVMASALKMREGVTVAHSFFTGDFCKSN